MPNRTPRAAVVGAAAALALAPAAGAQPARGAAGSRAVPVRVALTIAGQPAESRGTGVCYYRPQSTLGGKPARQWTVSYSAVTDGQPVAVVLSLTALTGAGVRPGTFSATLTAHRKLRRLAVGGARPAGRGTVTPAPDGQGWRFTFDATAADGAAVKGTVTCERTSPLG
jgi:hypothetical protein